MRRIVRALVKSPVIVFGSFALLAGLALIAFGVFRFGWRQGSPVFVGFMLVGFSAALLLPRIADMEFPEVPPPSPLDGGTRLPPAQEMALSVHDVERENVVAIAHRGNVARTS